MTVIVKVMMMLAMIVRKNMRSSKLISCDSDSESDDDVSYDSEEEHEEQQINKL